MLHWIVRYIEEFIDLSLEMAPWLLLGFIFAGILHVYMPKGSIRKYMGGKNLKSVIYASLLGIPLPLCSCGVIPTGIAFHKEGASKGSTVSFLISTPQTGVDSILATYSLLGLPFAILRPIVAFFSGIFGGAITNSVTRNDLDKQIDNSKPQNSEDLNGNGKFKTMLRYAFHDFLMDIAKWLIIGLAVAALIAVLLPNDFFVSYLHNEFLSMLIVLAASIPLYVCATGSIPIAAVLMMKGLSPGAALVFLIAGPATNVATMTVIGKAIDKKTLFVYLGTIVGSAMLFGLLTNQFLPREWFTFAIDHIGHEHELLPFWFKITSAILLAVLILNGYIRKYFIRLKTKTIIPDMSDQLTSMKISVTGMTCNHCKNSAENSVASVEGVKRVIADPSKSEVYIEGENINLDDVKKHIEDVGFSYHGLMK
ncbi:MAG: permease [Bacteroidales bacterium]|nr:permease [Bacteroidales bacterium]